MQTLDYFRSLTEEINVLKDRVRNFIGDKHWLTDGEWKESVIRAVLRRHLPASVRVGRGFIVAENWASPQIDILLFDSAAPVLYQDADLVFVAPDAVLAVLEIKTSVERNLDEAVSRLSGIAEGIAAFGRLPFTGLLAFEERGVDPVRIATALRKAAQNVESRIIPCVSVGNSCFVKYLLFGPEDRINPLHSWRAYKLPEIAPACFISNLIRSACPRSPSDSFGLFEKAQFPFPDIEEFKVGDVSLKEVP